MVGYLLTKNIPAVTTSQWEFLPWMYNAHILDVLLDWPISDYPSFDCHSSSDGDTPWPNDPTDCS